MLRLSVSAQQQSWGILEGSSGRNHVEAGTVGYGSGGVVGGIGSRSRWGPGVHNESCGYNHCSLSLDHLLVGWILFERVAKQMLHISLFISGLQAGANTKHNQLWCFGARKFRNLLRFTKYALNETQASVSLISVPHPPLPCLCSFGCDLRPYDRMKVVGRKTEGKPKPALKVRDVRFVFDAPNNTG